MRSDHRLTLDTSADFEIRVQGVVDARWADYFGGTLIKHKIGSNAPVSVLSGQFQDQAALLGMLNTLYNMGFPLLSFQCIEPNDASGSGVKTTDATSPAPTNVG